MSSDTNIQPKKKKWEFPNVFALLFGLIVLTTILSYFIPSGSFERVEKVINGTTRTLVVEGTYQTVEGTRLSFFNIFEAVFKGMEAGAPIIFFIFIVGGAFGILAKTEAIENGLEALVYKMENRKWLLIPIIMLFFALGGATFGMSEETIPFLFIIVPLAIRIGYNSMIGAAIVILGSTSGFTAAFFNPFTVGVAQGIAELPLFSGKGYRIIMWIVIVGVTILWVMYQANKMQKSSDTELDLIDKKHLKQYENDLEKSEKKEFTLRQKLIIAVFVLTIVSLAIGVTRFDWYIMEIASLFLLSGIVIGFIGNLSVNEISDGFIDGCKDLATGALIVGFAYGVLVVLEESMTIDTILNFLATSINQLPALLSAMGMFVVQSLINFLVPSGSGQAALSMPIMTPIADLTGVSRQTAVLAYQLGDGISNAVTPTSGVLMASLAIARIPWLKWAKFILPLLLIQYTLGAIFVTIAHLFVWIS